MAAVKKIPVAQITKDFAIKQKELFDLLKAHGLDKKSGTPFTEAEFSFFLAVLTADRQIENLDDYLTGKARILCGDKAEAPAEEKAPAEATPAPAPVEEKKAEEKKPEEKKPEEKPKAKRTRKPKAAKTEEAEAPAADEEKAE